MRPERHRKMCLTASHEEENGPQVAGEAILAMHDVANICQENDRDDPKELCLH